MSVVGIDIGTTFSKVAVAKNKAISVVPNDLTKLLTPTLVTFMDNERFLGEAATNPWPRQARNTVAQVKRLLGRQFDDPQLQAELQTWFLNEFQRMPDGRVGIVLRTSQGDQVMLPEQVLAGYMRKLKQFTTKYLDIQVRDCVVACPTYFDEAQRRALMTAAELAELKVLKLINETTATALGYGIMRTFSADTTTSVLFVDIGYSNTQVALVDYQERTLTVIGTAVNAFAGGRDIDNLLFNHFRDEFQAKHGIQLSDRPKAVVRLHKEVNKMKKVLSGNRDCVTMIEYFVDEIDFNLRMSRSQLVEMAGPVLEAIVQPIQDVLAQTGRDGSSIAVVEIIGGCSRIPYVQEAITNKLAQVGYTGALSQTLNGDECVARGATLMCAMLSPNYQVRKFEVKDISTFPVAVEYMKNDGARRDLIAPPNRLSPWTAKVTFSQDTFTPGGVFAFDLVQPEEYAQKGDQVTINYPMATDRRVGGFEIAVPELSKDLVQEPKIKLLVKQNKHGLINDPVATLIEFVKPPPEPETEEKPPEPTEAPATEEAQPEPSESKDEAEPMDVDEDSTTSGPATDEVGPEAMDTDEPAPAVEEKQPEPPKKPKKKKHSTTLAVRGRFYGSPSKEEYDAMFELEAQLATDDRVVFETNEKRNELEAYIYDTRDKLETEYREYIDPDSRMAFSDSLQESEDWLYEDGANASKSAYDDRIRQLRTVGDDLRLRWIEDQNRPAAITNLKSALGRYQRFAESTDEAFDHIDNADKDKVRQKVQEIDGWLSNQLIAQDRAGKTQNPVVMVADIENQLRQLSFFCDPIMNKPKPAPEPEPEPEAAPEQKDESKEEPQPMEEDQPATENAAESATDGVDVD